MHIQQHSAQLCKQITQFGQGHEQLRAKLHNVRGTDKGGEDISAAHVSKQSENHCSSQNQVKQAQLPDKNTSTLTTP